MKSFASVESAGEGRTARAGRILGAAVLAIAMSASMSALADEPDGNQAEDVQLGVTAVIDNGLGHESGTGLLDRERASGDLEADSNGVVSESGAAATASSSATAVGVSVSAGNLSIAVSNTTISQTVNQSATFVGSGGAGGGAY